jgi:hypothetical protein
MYVPLRIKDWDVQGIPWAMRAMRLPKESIGDSVGDLIGKGDLALASKLVKAGDDHAKAMRGIVVWLKIELQVGFMIEFETYRHGVEVLSTSSSMHGELKHLKGLKLAVQKQKDLPEKVYTRILTMSYQALKNIYRARRNHRHPDWRIFCSEFIEKLPYATELICGGL